MAKDFIRKIIDNDLAAGKVTQIVTRFPPEPNGFLHVGHAKAIVANFEIAREYGGKCYLRFDDTNPEKEEQLYAEAIKRDVQWLGYRWQAITHTSDYFEELYRDACRLIELDKAYVCELTAADIRAYRGTLTSPGRNSPYRDRPSTESLRLFQEMRAGKHDEGRMVLRAKIDMASPNISMRDPTIYRVKKLSHPRTGDQWCIYPLYDFSHCLADASEQISHSLCTLEFQDNRALYDWFVQALRPAPHPQQIEFARLTLSYTVTSKRRLDSLIKTGKVKGWDDPRLPTISGLRRRGFPAVAVKNFCQRIGLSKKETIIDFAILEDEVRNSLNESAPRTMAVLRPLKVTIKNFTNDQPLALEVPIHPQDATRGTRTVHFSNTIFIERDDFLVDPPKKFFRLKPQGRVRLRYAFVITCEEVVRADDGTITELICTYDPDTAKGKTPSDGKKVKGIIHWLSQQDSQPAKVYLYDRLLRSESWDQDDESPLNPQSLEIIDHALVSKGIAPEVCYQFERLGYFCLDKDSTTTEIVINRITSLRDTWAKIIKNS